MGQLANVLHDGGKKDGKAVIRSWAPATGELLGEVPVMGAAEVRGVVDRARRAQEAWGLLPIEERCHRMLRFRDALVDRAEELVDVLARENGKPRHEALAHEVLVLADLITYYAKHAPRWLAPRPVPLHLLKHRASYLQYVPRGVVGIIAPWNFPLVLSLSEAVAALFTGSAAVVKPSEVTPLVVLKAKEIWDASGLPPDLLGVVTGLGDTGAALIDAGIQKLCFTGGVATGRRVAAACGERLIPCVLELGGKAPLVACEDADVEQTARAIAFGGFANMGQICVSVERVYAHASVYDRLVERTGELVRKLRQGDPAKEWVDLGAVVFPRQIEVAERHIADAVAKGARVVTGGRRVTSPGQFFEPTVLADCNHSMTVMTEEIFGPVVPFMRVGGEEEAVRLSNALPLGLNAYVFSRDREKARRIAERIDAGSVVVNEVLINYACPEAPFGGMKHSGWGRVHGEDALRDMAECKHVNYDRFPLRKDPLWFPYSGKTYVWMLRALRAGFSGGSLARRIAELF